MAASRSAHPKPDKTRSLAEWEINDLIDEKVGTALKAYDTDQWGTDDERKPGSIPSYVNKKTARFESAYGVGKFVVAAVALLVIGTLYQLFVTLAQSGVGR